MTDMEQALLVSGGILVLMLIMQFGRRQYGAQNLRLAVVLSAAVGYFYFRGAPTRTADLVVYAVGALVGIGFGAWASAATGIERDRSTGSLMTRCGIGFVTAWVTCVAIRVAFIFCADHVGSFRSALGTFLRSSNVSSSAIAPFFVAMALVMVLSRVVLVELRASTLRADAGSRRIA
jgi:hypothetical protein